MDFQIIERNQNQDNFVQYLEKKVHLTYYSHKIEKFLLEKNLKIQKENLLTWVKETIKKIIPLKE